VIVNEREYRITKAWLEKFSSRAVGEAQGLESADDSDPRMRQLYRDAYESQAEELRGQLAEYEALQSGQVSVLELDSLSAPRIAARLTQKQLAERLGLREQQVQRYEATRYSGVTVERLQAVVDALGIQVREQVILPVAG